MCSKVSGLRPSIERPTLGPRKPLRQGREQARRQQGPQSLPLNNPNDFPQTPDQTESLTKSCGVSSILCGPLIPLLHRRMQLGSCL
jgi:hypothetical protein